MKNYRAGSQFRKLEAIEKYAPKITGKKLVSFSVNQVVSCRCCSKLFLLFVGRNSEILLPNQTQICVVSSAAVKCSQFNLIRTIHQQDVLILERWLATNFINEASGGEMLPVVGTRHRD